MIRLTADWILPITSDPIRNGVVTVDRGRILGVDSGAVHDAVSLGRVAVLPGLVNAHTHLELSHLRGRIPPTERFMDWVRPLLAIRRESPTEAPEVVSAAREAIRQSHASGTVVVGDVSNTLATVPLLRESRLAGRVFYELIGFGPGDAEARVASARAEVDAFGADRDGVRVSLAPHAPYSVSPALFTAIRADLDAHDPISTIHLGESPEEVELLARGSGGWRVLLEELGAWNSRWTAPGTSPVAYLSDLGFLDGHVLVVHAVQLDGDDLSRLAGLGAPVVCCPRSNQYVGVGAPPLETFYARGVDVAFGTDSLASVADLNLFSELTEARRLAPRVAARRLLESATWSGARALGCEADYGSIQAGRSASLVAVRLPEGVSDVEEYLVSGIEPGSVTWLDD